MKNSELIEQIKKFNPDAKVEGLNNKELESLLKKVKRNSEPEVKEQVTEKVEIEAKPVKVKQAIKAPVYVMAKGKAITKGGKVYGEGEKIKKDGIFSSHFEEYLDKGIIIEVIEEKK